PPQGFSALRYLTSPDYKALLPFTLGVTFLLCATSDILTLLQHVAWTFRTRHG
ncbi:MAG: hypothetical protein ACI9KK_002325, partial [Ascidiaceihabitans sp.]